VSICYSEGAKNPASSCAQISSTPHWDHRRVIHVPINEQESKSFTEGRQGRKEAICTLQGLAFPGCPSLRKTAGAPGEKPQTRTARKKGIKTITRRNFRHTNLSAE
jgi:hypothetical protein